MTSILTLFFISILFNPDDQVKTQSSTYTELATPEFLTGKNNYYIDTNFIEIPASMAYRSNMFLLKETYHAYLEMYRAAKKDGIDLKIMSASRTFEEQKWIWEDKWSSNNNRFDLDDSLACFVMQYSAMPGTSRHHWGTEVDLNSTSEKYFETASGKKVYEWLRLHGCDYGFCQTYDAYNATRLTGYREEKWHWSYFPLSNVFLKAYGKTVQYSHIQGFSGDASAKALQVIDRYVLAISNECR